MANRKLVAGNWKMNGLQAALSEVETLSADHPAPNCDVMLCPPATLIAAMAALEGPVAVGAQDCHAKTSGAHTGDISAQMVKDAGGVAVITGHSERRTDHGETDADVLAKSEAVQAEGLVAIICVGETEAERDAGKALDVVETQLAGSVPAGSTAENTVIAYEPVWAIGTGKVPVSADIEEMHAHMRKLLIARFGEAGNGMRLLYGGSVKPGNAAEIFGITDVDGALVGGASLKAADFGGIIAAV